MDGSQKCKECIQNQMDIIVKKLYSQFGKGNGKKATGVKVIGSERYEQLTKHKFDFEHDRQYVNGELKQAAIAILTGYRKDIPKDWENFFIDFNLKDKSIIDKLAIAGALIAAEIDRITFSDASI